MYCYNFTINYKKNLKNQICVVTPVATVFIFLLLSAVTHETEVRRKPCHNEYNKTASLLKGRACAFSGDLFRETLVTLCTGKIPCVGNLAKRKPWHTGRK